MNTVLITAYAVNPYKGSEDGMGWHFIVQAARFHRVVAVTRRNNRAPIERFLQEQAAEGVHYAGICFLYFDWPAWLLGWKKGPFLSMIYFYMWQLTLPVWWRCQGWPVDLVHNLNFHNDWTPSFLWMTNKPMVWGPIGHHSRIPRQYVAPVYGVRSLVKDRLLWCLKQCFWHTDPFLKVTVRRAAAILCMNQAVPDVLGLPAGKWRLVPSVAALATARSCAGKEKGFRVLAAGRFVPLKGFDLAIRSFAVFYYSLPADQRERCHLDMVGTGPCLPLLKKLIKEAGLEHCISMHHWVPRSAMDLLYQSASVFLFPSHEGAGMVVAEAMSYGLPVLCLDNEGPGAFLHACSDLKVKQAGYAETIQLLAERLGRLLSDDDYYRQEQVYCQDRFRSHLCWECRGVQLKEVYASVLPSTTLINVRI